MTADSTEAAPALKEIFNRERLRHIAKETSAVWPRFDGKRFLKLATAGLDDLGIMQRMRQTAVGLHETLPPDFPEALPILKQLAPRIGHSFAAITLSEFVALYGQKHFDLSLGALKFFTRFGSSEFAIRHFLSLTSTARSRQCATGLRTRTNMSAGSPAKVRGLVFPGRSS
jgi:3-methyladenine DNA glycosylase AlkC